MLMIVGITLIVVSIVMLFVFLRHARHPKIEGHVLEVKNMPMPKYPDQGKVPHARVSYRIHNRNYEEWVIVARRNTQAGESLVLSYKAENPEKIRVYAPHKELIAIGIVGAIGLALTLGSFIAAKKMGLY